MCGPGFFCGIGYALVVHGLILNVDDERLPADSPWRTREEKRTQPAVFLLADGYPVFEVWFFREGVWWCMSHSSDARLVAQGVRYFTTLEQLKQSMCDLFAGGVS